MLKENIQYRENLPINCTIMNLEEYPIHFHNDIEIVYVLQGNVRLKNGYYYYEMKEGDVYILNDREIHSYNNMGESNAVLILQLSLSYFSRYYETLKNSFFITDTNGVLDESIEEVRELLAQIALEYMSSHKGFEDRIISLSHNLINCLISNFQYFAMEDGKFVNETKNKGNKVLAGRLSRITEYMYENYNRRLTLTEIAEREHLSIYYLSHFIKEATGLSFQELLSFIRVEESEKLLLGTEKKIGVVSVESGFSAVRYYIKYFTKWFGMHPSDYREKYTGYVRGRDIAGKYVKLPDKVVEELLCKHVDDIFSVARKNRIEIVSAEFDTEEYVWNESDYYASFIELMGKDYMRPMVEIMKSVEIQADHVVAGSNGYYIMKGITEEKGYTQPFYSILFYNFNDKLLSPGCNNMSKGRVTEEIKKYNKSTEYYIKLIGMNGLFRIGRCKFSKESILGRHKKIYQVQKSENKRHNLTEEWSVAPYFSVNETTANQVLGIQAQLSGSGMELVLIDPVYNNR